MKQIYLHTYDMPKSCVDCDFRQNTYCKAQQADDGEYVSCRQEKVRMKNGKPITCPLMCIESGELCDREEVRKETAREIADWLRSWLEWDEEGVVQAIIEKYDLEEQK